jgi:hypothetical protein
MANAIPGAAPERELGPVAEYLGELLVVQASRLLKQMQAGRLHHKGRFTGP